MQVMSQAAASVAPTADAPVLPQGFATAGAARPAAGAPAQAGASLPVEIALPAAFGEQLARSARDTSAEAPAQTDAVDTESSQDGSEPNALALPEAEQWLQSMLDQQAVSIQARDHAEAAQADADALAPLPGGELAALLGAQVAAAPAQGLPGKAAPLPNASPVARAEGAVDALPAASSTPVGKLAEVLPVLANTADSLDGQLTAQLDRLAGSAPQAVDGNSTATLPYSTNHQLPALERHLTLQAPESKWGEQMLHALRDSVELQVRHNVQNASIRLDPPELGSLEIYLSHDSGRLNVQISAAQGDVARLLQQTSDRLRQELVGQNFVQVNVQVSADSQSGGQHGQQGRHRPFDDEPVLAQPRNTAQPESGQTGPASDVLVTV
nr:flagellar hook-length control protein FliK [Pseudomonas insulae]